MHNERKVQLIRDALYNYSKQPIIIVKGTSGIGKLYLCKELLKQLRYQILEIDSSFQDIWILNKAHPLEYSIKDQLSGLDNQRVIIVKEIGEIQDYSQLRFLQQKYTSTKCSKPLVIIINTTVTRDYQLTKIFGQDFLKKYCIIVELKCPTNKKIEQYLLACFPKINLRVSNQIAELSNGDLRNAFNQAFVYLLNYRDEKQSKDSKITFFNTIGRVLYNKRLDNNNTPRQLSYEEMISKPEPKFYFDPYELVETVPVTQQTYRGFLFLNSLKFFNDLKEIKQFYDIQSEGDILEKTLCRYDRFQGHQFSHQCLVSEVITLGYMVVNKHVKPEKSLMMTLNGPQDYQFRQDVAQKKQEFRQLKPFKSYQKDLVLAALGRKNPTFSSKTTMQLKLGLEDNGTDQSWFEDNLLTQNPGPKIQQQLSTNIRIKKNQCEMISKNKKQRLIDIYTELLN